MQVSVEKLEGLERRLAITVPANDIEPEVAKRLQEVAKKANLKGFRPGKVPMALVKQYFGDSVRAEVLEKIVPKTLEAAVKQEKLDMAGLVNVEATNTPKADAPYQFNALIEIFPKIELKPFSQISVEKPEATISDEDIDKMIEEMRASHAAETEVDRAAQEDDVVLIDFKGLVDGEPFPGGSHNNYKLTLGSNSFIEGFEAGLVGAKAGDNKVLNLVFPKDYQEASLASKAVTFMVTVKKILESQLPEVNDAFAKKIGIKAGTVAALREDVQEKMQRQLKSAIEQRLKQQVVDQLLVQYDFAVPKSLVHREVDAQKQQMLKQFAHLKDVEKLIDSFPMDEMAKESTRRVKLGLLFNAIITQHELKVDDKAIDAEIQAMASEYEQPQHFINMYSRDQQRRAQIETFVAERQVIEKILADAKINTQKMSYTEAVKPPVPAAASSSEKSEKNTKQDVVG